MMHETDKESKVRGVSVRGWIAMTLVLVVSFCQTVTVLAQIYVNVSTGTWSEIKIDEPLYSMVMISIGFYFAKDQQKKETPASPAV